MHLPSTLSAAFNGAKRAPDIGSPPGDRNRNRSKRFVEALAEQFRASYSDSGDVVVLSKHYDKNRDRFGLNELLYDIAVCTTATTRSAVAGAELTYVVAGLWAVESEFARDSRQAIFDFNKLVLSSSEQKLFIGPQVSDESAFLQVLGHVADACSGIVFVALVPHPAEWDRNTTQEIGTWRREGGVWTKIDA